MANEWGADTFVSIHADAWHKETARGISTHVYLYCKRETLSLAAAVQRELVSWFPKHVNRGIKRSNFYVLHKTAMPAILIECEFISNPETRRFLKEPENQIKIARSVAMGICQHFNE